MAMPPWASHAIPPPRGLEALIITRDGNASVGQQPASLDRTGPMLVKPLGCLRLADPLLAPATGQAVLEDALQRPRLSIA